MQVKPYNLFTTSGSRLILFYFLTLFANRQTCVMPMASAMATRTRMHASCDTHTRKKTEE